MQKQHCGEYMIICVAVGAGLLSYILNMMCQYDLETEKNVGRLHYLFQIKKERGIFFLICIIFCLALTWLFSQYHFGPLKVIKYLLLLAGLYPIAWEDAREKKIPNRWLLYLLVGRGFLFLAETICFPAMLIENAGFLLFGGLVSGAVFLLAYVVSRHAIGMGDVKLIALIGLFLGFRVTYFVMLAALILSAVYGGVMVLRKKKSVKDEIAFGPFVAAGTLMVLLIGA